jgi:hypothetical protein
LEGYVDVDATCKKEAKDKLKLDLKFEKKASQKEARNKEGATKKNSKSAEAAKEQREKNKGDFTLLKGPKKSKLPPGSSYNMVPPPGELF